MSEAALRQAPPIDADQLDAFGLGDIPYRPVTYADALTQTSVDLPNVRQYPEGFDHDCTLFRARQNRLLLTATFRCHHAPAATCPKRNCGLLVTLRRRAKRHVTPLGRYAADFHSPQRTPTRMSQHRRRDEQNARRAGAGFDQYRNV
jgi:hypothetical protein